MPFTVIIPCYNEEKKLLKDCINSIINSEGNKQIILVDNNSNKKETIDAINYYKNNKNVLILSEKRQGKRFAHSKGLEFAKNELIIFVDSDTIVEKNAFRELIKPMQDDNIGAVCGNIKLANRNKNFFTKCLSSMYWNSFEFNRNATSSIGYLNVCSGALSCYRKNLLIELEEEYLNQKFLGSECSISDDTFSTIRIQSRFGKKVEYMNSAVGYTHSPHTFKGFWKQLVRWRQGFLRESILMWKEPKKNIKLLFLDNQYNLITQFLFVILRAFLIINLVFNFSLSLLILVVLSFFISTIILSIYQMVHNPKNIPYILGYSLFYEFIFIFTYIHALIKIKNQGKWGTR